MEQSFVEKTWESSVDLYRPAEKMKHPTANKVALGGSIGLGTLGVIASFIGFFGLLGKGTTGSAKGLFMTGALITLAGLALMGNALHAVNIDGSKGRRKYSMIPAVLLLFIGSVLITLATMTLYTKDSTGVEYRKQHPVAFYSGWVAMISIGLVFVAGMSLIMS